ncbi:MAG TPA: glycosyltransferase, partial [Gemmataceae bacterium]|nr:glycosyltransferase [Gemmataceae bacterium]
LDIALRYGLRVMVGLPWEQHVTFLEDRKTVRSIEERVRRGVRLFAGHPAVLCYAVGNEIPAPIVRWHGRRRVERFLQELYAAAKSEDPDGLITYVSYPTTEYLQLPFLDLVCFNVYLESQASFEAYLARLQNIACERPLLMAEIGLDSRRNGEAAQARALDWQIRSAFASGCAGAFVFSWTDEWFAPFFDAAHGSCQGGYDMQDWDFGLITRDRRPKQALAAVKKSFDEAPFPSNRCWPRISVVVCTCNGERTIRQCLEGLLRLNYPNFEVVVVDDGSTDGTAAIAREFGFRVFSTENRGLSAARNLGLDAATGEIVAYIDDDAYPDPDWLRYLAFTFLTTDYVGVGGPNLPPADTGFVAQCIANSPGGPMHVLLSDREAEHIPGCNMAFRKSCLMAIGGFDTQFRVAGDDVDICWRLQQQGWKLGFHAAAVVWHYRRNSVRAYWRQQKGYGKAEALLEKKWPGKYNVAGHVTWAGKIYSQAACPAILRNRWRIYYGTWARAPFQRLYQAPPGTLESLPQMPEWYLVVLALALLCGLGGLWRPLLLALPLFFLALGLAVFPVAVSAAGHRASSRSQDRLLRLKYHLLTSFLHVLQPVARLWGRLTRGSLGGRRGARGLSFPRARAFWLWSEAWQAFEERLQRVETDLRAEDVRVVRGGDYDDWDLDVRAGVLAGARIRMVTQEHGGGRQLVRCCSLPRYSWPGYLTTAVLAGLSGAAAAGQSWAAAAILGSFAALPALLSLWDCAAATTAVRRVLQQSGFEER